MPVRTHHDHALDKIRTCRTYPTNSRLLQPFNLRSGLKHSEGYTFTALSLAVVGETGP
jgi:hypothetical protein